MLYPTTIIFPSSVIMHYCETRNSYLFPQVKISKHSHPVCCPSRVCVCVYGLRSRFPSTLTRCVARHGLRGCVYRLRSRLPSTLTRTLSGAADECSARGFALVKVSWCAYCMYVDTCVKIPWHPQFLMRRLYATQCIAVSQDLGSVKISWHPHLVLCPLCVGIRGRATSGMWRGVHPPNN
jgi:hypothetical protein